MVHRRIKYSNTSNQTFLGRPYDIPVWQQYGYKCAKTFVIIFNIFFWLFGWTLIGVGISLRSNGIGIDAQSRDFSTIGEDHVNYNFAPQLCISVGCITIIVVLLVCSGVFTENHFMLGTYILVVGIILCFEMGAIAVTSLYREKIEQRIINDIKFTMNLYEQPNFEAITNCIDSFQKTFRCCGCIYYQDWYDSTWGKLYQGNVPSSCLKKHSLLEALYHNSQINTSTAFFDINTKGCFEHVRDYFAKNLYFFGTFVAWIIGIQLVSLAFSVCLFCKITYHKTELAYRYQSIAAEQ